MTRAHVSYVLRAYQAQAVDAGDRELLARMRALIVAATGAGKTVIFAAMAERWVMRCRAANASRGHVLVLAHRQELLDQAADKFAAATMLSTGIEQSERRVRRPLPDVVIASVPTLASEERRAAFGRNAFDLIICDEAHHYCAPMFREVVDYFTGARLGVTATPTRADGLQLSTVFGNTVFRYGIRTACRDGHLVDIRRVVELLPGLELSKLKPQGSDWTDAQLEAELIKAPAVAAVADAALKHAPDRPSVLFCAGIAHSKAVAAALNARRPGCAAAAWGMGRAGLADYVAGRVQYLANADLTTEGFDHPPTSGIFLVRPTMSITKATQQIGRGTRLSPDTGKENCFVVEFCGGSASEQISTVDVIGADLPARTRAIAETLLDRNPSMSVLDALDRAAAGAGSGLVAPARPSRAVADPMALILSLDGMVKEPPRPGAPAASAAQLQLLEKSGLRVAGLDARQAAFLLMGIQWRLSHGRSSPAQALELARLGFTIETTASDANRKLAQMRVGSAA